MKNRKAIKALILVFILFLGLLFFAHYSDYEGDAVLSKYYIEKGQKLTASKNIVTGIYLDFRMYDSFFEALILLTAVVGIYYLNNTEGGI